MQGIKIQLLRRSTDESDEPEEVQQENEARAKQAEEAIQTMKKDGPGPPTTIEQEREDKTGKEKADEVLQPHGEENGTQKRRGRKND